MGGLSVFKLDSLTATGVIARERQPCKPQLRRGTLPARASGGTALVGARRDNAMVL